MLETIVSILMTLADLQLFSISLDTLYIPCLGSGVAGIGVNLSRSGHRVFREFVFWSF